MNDERQMTTRDVHHTHTPLYPECVLSSSLIRVHRTHTPFSRRYGSHPRLQYSCPSLSSSPVGTCFCPPSTFVQVVFTHPIVSSPLVGGCFHPPLSVFAVLTTAFLPSSLVGVCFRHLHLPCLLISRQCILLSSLIHIRRPLTLMHLHIYNIVHSVQ
jgi:hypothetical protein